jgi:hypothetical protein
MVQEGRWFRRGFGPFIERWKTAITVFELIILMHWNGHRKDINPTTP